MLGEGRAVNGSALADAPSRLLLVRWAVRVRTAALTLLTAGPDIAERDRRSRGCRERKHCEQRNYEPLRARH